MLLPYWLSDDIFHISDLKNSLIMSRSLLPCNFHLFAEESGTGDQGNNQDFSTKFQSFVAPLLLLGFVLSSVFMNPREQKQVSPYWDLNSGFPVSPPLHLSRYPFTFSKRKLKMIFWQLFLY